MRDRKKERKEIIDRESRGERVREIYIYVVRERKIEKERKFFCKMRKGGKKELSLIDILKTNQMIICICTLEILKIPV